MFKLLCLAVSVLSTACSDYKNDISTSFFCGICKSGDSDYSLKDRVGIKTYYKFSGFANNFSVETDLEIWKDSFNFYGRKFGEINYNQSTWSKNRSSNNNKIHIIDIIKNDGTLSEIGVGLLGNNNHYELDEVSMHAVVLRNIYNKEISVFAGIKTGVAKKTISLSGVAISKSIKLFYEDKLTSSNSIGSLGYVRDDVLQIGLMCRLERKVQDITSKISIEAILNKSIQVFAYSVINIENQEKFIFSDFLNRDLGILLCIKCENSYRINENIKAILFYSAEISTARNINFNKAYSTSNSKNLLHNFIDNQKVFILGAGISLVKI